MNARDVAHKKGCPTMASPNGGVSRTGATIIHPSELVPSKSSLTTRRVVDAWMYPITCMIVMLAASLMFADPQSDLTQDRVETGLINIAALSTMVIFGFLLLASIWSITTTHGSIPNRLVRRLLPQKRHIRSARRAIEKRWDQSTIESVQIEREPYLKKDRTVCITLPNGAIVMKAELYAEDPKAWIYEGPGSRHPDQALRYEALSGRDAFPVIDAVRRMQTRSIALLIDLPEDTDRDQLTVVMARMVPLHSVTFQQNDSSVDLRMHLNGNIVRKHVIESLGISVFVNRKNGEFRSDEVLVHAPGIGTLALDPLLFDRSFDKRRSSELTQILDEQVRDAMAIPTFIGNARASRIADLARRLLSERPDILGDDGNPIRTLVENHMPRLLATHRDSLRVAQTEDVARIDAELDRGLDVIARALGDAMDRLADQGFDRLRTEVRFLESRHPEAATTPVFA